MLKTSNSLAFGATYGITLVKAANETVTSRYKIKACEKLERKAIRAGDSKIIRTISLKDGVILVAKEAETAFKTIKQRLSDEGFKGKKLNEQFKKELEKEAYARIYVNA